MLNLLCDFTSTVRTIGYVLLAFVVLLFMVMIHETGHYIAGKILGFQINEFAIGMGPKIFSKKKKNGEVFSLRIFPLGGFCAFEGEDEENENPKAFNKQKPWKRLIVLFSGAFFNFISAILIAIIAFSCFGDTVATVSSVYEYAPQANQQLQSGDIIYKIDGKRVFVLDNISRFMSDDEMTFTVLRPIEKDGKVFYEEFELKNLVKGNFVSVVMSKVDGEYYSGERKLQVNDNVYKLNGNLLYRASDFKTFLELSVDSCILTVTDGDKLYDYELPVNLFTDSKLVTYESPYSGIGMSIRYEKHRFSFGESLVRSVPYCCEVGMLVLRTLGGLITGVVGVDQVGGPITTISMTSQIISTGFANVLSLIVLISVNLAVFNLLPVPALDGCRMVFVIIEWIAGKPINRKVEAYINGIGLIVLIVLMVLIDILKL